MIKFAVPAGAAVWAHAKTDGDFACAFVEECRIRDVEAKAARQLCRRIIDDAGAFRAPLRR